MPADRQPLSELAHKGMLVTAARVQREGLDLWQELNRVGLLATKPRIQEIEVSALKNLLDRFDSMGVDDFLRGVEWHRRNSNPATPADLLAAIRTWLDTYIDYIAHD